MEFKEFPKPNYDYDVNRLVKAYEKALKKIQSSLQTLDMNDYQQAFAVSTIKDISDTLKKLNVNTDEIITEIIPNAAKNGVAETLVSLGVVETVTEAKKIVSFGKINKRLVETMIADTQEDLLAVTKNVERRVRNSVRKSTAEVLRETVTRGVNHPDALSRKLREKIVKDLGTAANSSIVDAAGRRWKLKTYTDMLTRTKLMQAQRESTINEAIERDAYYGVISRHHATDACAKWEGKIVKYIESAPGPYPYIESLSRREIFHPNCRHVVSTIGDLSRLPDELKLLNNIE